MAYAIIIGGGKIGYYLTRSLINRDYEVLLMERDPILASRLRSDLGDVVMHGDGCEPTTLRQAGAERADLLVAATGDNSSNLVSSQMAARCLASRASSRASTTPTTNRYLKSSGCANASMAPVRF